MEVVKGELGLKLDGKPADYSAIHRALLAGLLSQVAQRKEQGEYLGANGTRLAIHPGSGQFKSRPPWIVSAEQVQTTRVYARNVARIDPKWVEDVGAHLVRRQGVLEEDGGVVVPISTCRRCQAPDLGGSRQAHP